MNKTLTTAYAAMTLLAVSSCAHEGMPERDPVRDNRIIFRASLPGVTSRATDITSETLTSCRVSAFNLADPALKKGNFLDYYFENQPLTKEGDAFRSNACVWPGAEYGEDIYLEFYAFYPSLEEMAERAAMENAPVLYNRSAVKEGADGVEEEIFVNYGISGIRIPYDISDQFDFVTAYAEEASRAPLDIWDTWQVEIHLNLRHRLAKVGFQAWGDNKDYDFEIAGVRIGQAATDADFAFVESSETSMDTVRWNPASIKLHDVEYIYGEGDRIFTIDGNSHNSSEKKGSFMGSGGDAMIIPGVRHQQWDAAYDRENARKGMYAGVLLRVLRKDNGAQAYPAAAQNRNEIVLLAVEPSSGTVLSRVYRSGDSYYSDSACTLAYSPEEGVEVREYAWSAIPFTPTPLEDSAPWEQGKRYSYTFDFSNGAGLKTPDDEYSGFPVLQGGLIGWDVDIEDWKEKEETDIRFEGD